MAAIQGIVAAIGSNHAVRETAGSSDSVDFADVLGDVLDDAVNAESTSEQMAARFADGEPGVGLHEVVISAEKAAITMRFAVTLKNRVIDAYRELMSTQI